MGAFSVGEFPVTRKDLEPRGSFDARDDDGNIYRVNYYIEVLKAPGPGGSHSRVEGNPRLFLDDGTELERKGKGTYLLIRWPKEIILRSDDPEAV